jgi:hypothetical protein
MPVVRGEELLVWRVGRMAIAPVLKTGAAKVAYRFESCTLRVLDAKLFWLL